MAELIKQAYLVAADSDVAENAGSNSRRDVLIEAGVISAIASNIDPPDNAVVIEAEGQYLGPGLIDLYSHSGEPGYESRETIDSLLAAAAAGGFTRVGILPTVDPVVDSPGDVAAIITARRNSTLTAKPKLLPWAAITQNAAGEQLTELAELADTDAVGFTDGRPIQQSALLRRLLEYAQPLQKPIALYPCDPILAGSGVAREGPDALRLGLPQVSAVAETSVVSALIEYAAQIAAPIHLMRISTARSVQLIQQAKASDIAVTASVPWHHLLLDTQSLDSYDPALRHEPPLGTASDREALIQGVRDGVIDAISVDHAPFTYEEKTVAFTETPPGAIGLELALPLLWQTFVSTGQMEPALLWHRLCQGPAQCLAQKSGQLKVGDPAELTLFDPSIEWMVNSQELRSHANNTPWLNQTLTGRATRIWIND